MSGAVIGGLVTGALYSLIAVGIVIVFRSGGAINFAQGDVGAVGALISITLSQGAGHVLPIWLAVLVGMLVGATMNAVIYFVFIRHIDRRGAHALVVTLVATLATSSVIESVLGIVYGYNSYQLHLFQGVSGVEIFGVAISPDALALLASAALALVAVAWVLYRTRAGLFLRMGASDARLATLSGANVVLIRGLAWAVTGAISAWAVMLFSAYEGVTVLSMGSFLLASAVAASWGGFRSVGWTATGAVVTAVVTDVVSAYVSTPWPETISLALLVIVISVRLRLRGNSVEGGDRVVAPLVAGSARLAGIRRPRRSGGEVVLVAAAGVVVWYVGNSFAVGLLQQGSYTLIALIGLSVAWRYGGRISLASAAVMAFAGYVDSISGVHIGAVWLALIALGLSGVGGLAVGAICRRMELVYYANVTLLMVGAIPEVANWATRLTGGAGGETVSPWLGGTILGGRSSEALLMFGLALVVMILFVWFGRSRLGSYALAAGTDPLLAGVMGLRWGLARMLLDGATFTVMGLAGMLYAQYSGFLTPDSVSSVAYANLLLAGVIIAGGWSVLGLAVGAAVLVWVPAEVASLNGALPGVIFGVVLLAIVMFAPEGLESIAGQIGRRSRTAGRFRGRWPGSPTVGVSPVEGGQLAALPLPAEHEAIGHG